MQVDLFGSMSEHRPASQAESAAVWTLVDHACSFCGGRILSRGAGRRVQYRCSECGEVGAVDVTTLCCCGVRTEDKRRLLECIRNDDRRPGNMAEIVVREFKERSI